MVRHKAKEAFRRLGHPVLVEDTSLTFKALGNLPGPLIKWFLTELANKGLCLLLDGFKSRLAVAKVNFALYEGKKLKIFEGKVKGSVSHKPCGKLGFGWDPIFIPKGFKKT